MIPNPPDPSLSSPAPRILLLPLEFPTWGEARHWTYCAQLGLEEGFAGTASKLTVYPVYPDSWPWSATWLSALRALLDGERFDQVWLEGVHTHLNEPDLEWIAGLAPVRVGLVAESLGYTDEEAAQQPELRKRTSRAEQRLPYFTHVLTIDERDAETINQRGQATAAWWPAAVPERSICDWTPAPTSSGAIFSGSLHGRRSGWLDHPSLRGILVASEVGDTIGRPTGPFDRLHRALAGHLATKLPMQERDALQFVIALRELRREAFGAWVAHLQTAPAVVNLPHYVKSYAGRVVESMAAGRPMISWEIPDRPRNRALFEDNQEILLYPDHDPAALADRIAQVTSDTRFGKQLANNARQKIRAEHTIERRVQQALTWIRNGTEPAYE